MGGHTATAAATASPTPPPPPFPPPLPPATAVTSGPPPGRVTARTVSGPLLRLSCALMEAPGIGPALAAGMMWASGVTRTLRAATLPDPPCYAPVWPEGEGGSGAVAFPARTAVTLDPADPVAAASAAAAAVGVPPAAASAAPRPRPPPPALPTPPAPGRARTAAEYAAAFASGSATPLAVADAALAAIDALAERGVPTFAAVDRAAVRAAAAASTARWAAGAPLSPVDGLLFAVKDNIDVAGLPSFSGRAPPERGGHARPPAAADAPAVGALKAAGAVPLGKAHMVEFGLQPLGSNKAAGATPGNPHDPAGRLPGGSSSGCAAAVAAGLVALALGNDGGGSIRIPAALCGIVGLKPTFGRDSPAGCHGLAGSSVTVCGPLAPTVADAALLYGATANAGRAHPRGGPRPAPTLPSALCPAPPLTGVRVGVPSAWVATADDAVLPHFEAGLAALAAAGATLVRGVVIPELGLARAAHIATMGPEGLAGLGNEVGCRAGRAPLNLDTRVTAVLVRSALRADDYVAAARARTRAMAHVARLFHGGDGGGGAGGSGGSGSGSGGSGSGSGSGGGAGVVHFLATPATACLAPARRRDPATFDRAALFGLVHFASAFNLTGLPALSVPVGFDDATGLPVGFQLVGPAWSEAGLLAVGAALEAGVAGRVAAGAAAAAAAFPGRRVLVDPLAAATTVESVTL